MKVKNKIKKIGLGYFSLDEKAKNLITGTLEKGRISPGPITDKFEKRFAGYHGCKFGIFTNSGTSALKIALHALKSIHRWNDGDEVLVPAITFVATSNIVLLNKMKPVFVDVAPETYNIDPKQIEKHITLKTRAIIPVHLFGLPAEMNEIIRIAKKHKLKVIEDSCECMGVRYMNSAVGSLGDIACFSTYMAHLLVTGVGGLAITNNPQYALKMKSLMNHGRDSIYLRIDDDDSKKGSALFEVADKRFSFIDIGYSARATEMEAALGLVELDKLKKQIKIRQKNAVYLIQKLKPLESHIRLSTVPRDREHAFMMFPVTIISNKFKRAELIHFLENNGIETRYAMPLLNQPVYKRIFGNLEEKYPVAKFINKNSFYIGCHQGLNKDELDYIVRRFFEFFRKKKLI